MATAISADTSKDLRDTMVMVKKIGEDDGKLKPQYKKMYEGLKGAIDAGSEDEIELYRPQLEKLAKSIDATLHSVQGALALLANLRKDESLMESKFDQIEKLVKAMAETRKRLATWSAESRKLVNSSEKALDDAKNDAESVEADLSALQDEVKQLTTKMKQVDEETKKQTAAARKAAAAKNQKALTDARLKLIDLRKLDGVVSNTSSHLEKFKAQYKKEITREQEADVTYMIDDLESAKATMKAVGAAVTELMALGQVAAKGDAKAKDDKAVAKKPEPVPMGEIKNAAKAIELPPAEVSKLADILNKNARDKWPPLVGKLAQTLKMKQTDGKALVATIMKQAYFKKSLIDI